tara:strand:+ start:410 stop:628 length:219 start_codon:yes stop_codon:yes gene_type:complete
MIIEEEEEEDVVIDDIGGYLPLFVSNHIRPSYDRFDKYLENIRDAQSFHKFKTFRDQFIDHVNAFKRTVPKV